MYCYVVGRCCNSHGQLSEIIRDVYLDCTWFARNRQRYFRVSSCLHCIYSVSRKKWAPKYFAFTSANTPRMYRTKLSVTKSILSYCRQISYDSIISLDRFSFSTNCCLRFQLPTLLVYTHDTCSYAIAYW